MSQLNEYYNSMEPSRDLKDFVNKEIRLFLGDIINIYPCKTNVSLYISLASNIEQIREDYEADNIPIKNRNYSMTILVMN